MSTKCKKSCGLCTGKRDGKRTGQGKITGTGNRRGRSSVLLPIPLSFSWSGNAKRCCGLYEIPHETT